MQEPSGHPHLPASGEKKPPKRFIKSNVSIHDRTQVEAVFDYYLGRATQASGKQLDKLRYRVEAFLFFPRQFGLNAITYPKSDFYNDIRPLIRFREPKLGFKRMQGLRPGADSPLIYLKQYVQDVLEGKNRTDPQFQAVSEARLFACCLISAFLRNVDRWRRRLSKWNPSAHPAPSEMISNYLRRIATLIDKMQSCLDDFRAIRKNASMIADSFALPLQQELDLVDEYCFYRLKDALAHLLLITEAWRNDDTIPEVKQFNQKLKIILEKNEAYAKKNGFMLIGINDDKKFRERYIRRRGELKRRMWSILFLDLRAIKIFTFQQHFGPMIAAGLAALWAAIAQVLLVTEALFRNRPSDLLGISGMIFLLMAVVAYIIKDRIKEIGRSYFRSGLFRKLPDHSERIYYDTPLTNRREVGNLKEIAKFEKVETLPPPIRAIRAQHGTLEGLEHDNKNGVLRYTKDVIISTDLSILGRYPLKVVHDILRLNIDACLPRLDEPTRQIPIIGSNLDIHALDFPKVYYFDIALSYSHGAPGKESVDDRIDYFRLVLDKSGLVRVERLS